MSKPDDSDRRSDSSNTAGSLRRVRWTILRNTVAGKLSGSRLRLSTVATFGLLFWVGLFAIFFEGFQFLNQHRLLSGPLIEMLFGLFFASLLVMLVFSTGIILYAGLFASMEARFLLVHPIAADQVFAFKFQEALFFSSWGFILLGSPLMAAYGLSAAAPLVFYAISLAYFLAFALIPASVGALACLVITYYLPRHRRQALVGLGLAVLIGGGLHTARVWRGTQGTILSQGWLSSIFDQLRLGNLPFLPSQWISRGLLAAAQPEGQTDAVFYLLLLLSNALFLYLIAAVAYARLYRLAYDRIQSSGARYRRRRAWLPGLIDRLFAPLPGPMRVLILKDARIFMSDPVQWSQVLIFTGLLAFYFITLGRMNYYTSSPYWRNLIGFFNLAVTGLILSTFTSRFVFPLLSLEGQKLWILGLCPIRRDVILWSKFAFASGGAILVTFSLTLLSAFMLHLEPLVIALQLVTVSILCFGISGIAVGLGARFPDMSETDPSKIAAGFGGTLNLVASMLFILVVIFTMALPCHLYSITLTMERGATDLSPATLSSAGLSFAQFRIWLAGSMGASLLVGTLGTYVPMRMGIRAFRTMEF